MIGRITQLMTTQQVLTNITQAQDQIDTTQEQLSTGKSINQPSDDPYGASLAVQLNGEISGLNSYSSSVTDGSAWATASDTALQNVSNMVQRVRELVVGASNGTQSKADLAETASEVSQLTDAIKQEGNAQYAGQYIFSGTASTTPPYSTATGDAYQGNSGSVTREIGPNTSLQVNTDISQVLGSGQTAGGSGDGKLLDVLRSISANLNGGTPADVASLSSTDLSGLDTNMATLGQVQANVGATENRLTLATTRIASLQVSTTSALSNTQDVNMASALTAYSVEQAAYSAALHAGATIVQSSLMSFLT
jgi:flagellar hook-associated protein 3 FlgL